MLRLLLFCAYFLSVSCLSPFLSYYEPLTYRTSDVARISRSAQPHDEVKVEFDAFNRTFKLRLRKISPQESVFVEGATITLGNETITVERGANYYKGKVEGDDFSRAYGSIYDGVFHGTIETTDGKQYGVEQSIFHNSSSPFHSFIYDVTHIQMPKLNNTKRYDGVYPERESMCGVSNPKMAASMRGKESVSSSTSSSNRYKRDAKTDDLKQCRITFDVDHVLFRQYMKKYSSAQEATQKLMDLIEREINKVNAVYRKSDFEGITGIEFAASHIEIWNDEKKSKPEYPFKDENVDVNTFLANIANYKLPKVKTCLAYAMTYRDFAGGTLGLAYVGGLCSIKQSAGIVTYLNHGLPVLEETSYLTLAHEIGHNFGAEHDLTGSGCEGEGDGQFIMYYSATSGHHPNNRKFSPCSNKAMSAKLLDVKSRTGDGNCFTKTGSPICGNGIVEKIDRGAKEECDCGRTEEECREKGDLCCVPGDQGEEKGCKLKAGKTCAPSQGPCCDATCTLKGPLEICQKETDCAEEAKCGIDGVVEPECPEPKAKDNALKTPCDDANGMCYNGKCNTTRLCESLDAYEDCMTKDKTCIRHCKKKGENQECVSTAHLPEFLDAKYLQKGRWGQSGVMLRKGSQCLDGQGVCDQFDICRKVDAEGSMSKTFQAFKSFGDTMINEIHYLIIAIIVIVIILVVVIKFCSYATPSSNPNKPKAKSIKQIKNMMSDRVKRISGKRKPRQPKVPSTGTPTARTPSAVQTPADTKEKTVDDEE